MNEEASKKLQELQILERNLQSFMAQKQAFQLELTETTNALEEISKTESDIFKLVGQIMLKADKKKTIEDLEEKKKLLELSIYIVPCYFLVLWVFKSKPVS